MPCIGLPGPQRQPAFDAEAVPGQVVVTAAGADQTPGWLARQPLLAVAPVPVSVLGAQHPFATLGILDREIPDRDSKRPDLEPSPLAGLDQPVVALLRIAKGIQAHLEPRREAGF